MFCPFINSECVPECIFNNNCYDEGDSENCNIMDAIRNIQSDGFIERTPKDYFESIEHILENISSNTAQTESWDINNKLDDILISIKEIKKRL
ncbi:MAG: hypothetical protein K1W19_03335 [Lachnospiraceae bacterium]